MGTAGFISSTVVVYMDHSKTRDSGVSRSNAGKGCRETGLPNTCIPGDPKPTVFKGSNLGIVTYRVVRVGVPGRHPFNDKVNSIWAHRSLGILKRKLLH